MIEWTACDTYTYCSITAQGVGDVVGAYLPGVRCLDTFLLSFLDDQRWGGSDGQIGSMYALSRQPRTTHFARIHLKAYPLP